MSLIHLQCAMSLQDEIRFRFFIIKQQAWYTVSEKNVHSLFGFNFKFDAKNYFSQ